jgi:hypothetical protein
MQGYKELGCFLMVFRTQHLPAICPFLQVHTWTPQDETAG